MSSSPIPAPHPIRRIATTGDSEERLSEAMVVTVVVKLGAVVVVSSSLAAMVPLNFSGKIAH